MSSEPQTPDGTVADLEARAWWEPNHGDVVLLSDATDALEVARLAAAPSKDDTLRAAEAETPSEGASLATPTEGPEEERCTEGRD